MVGLSTQRPDKSQLPRCIKARDLSEILTQCALLHRFEKIVELLEGYHKGAICCRNGLETELMVSCQSPGHHYDMAPIG